MTEPTGLIGPNGVGKSTLMRALSGLHRPVDGRVLLADKSITAFSEHRIAGSGLVPEGRQVFPDLSVADNIRLGGFARPEFDAEREVKRMLDRFPSLRERKDNHACLLSGREQQMLAIARGLVAKPRILMLDKPSPGLAPALIDRLYTVLAELRDEGGTILLVEQMAAMVLSIADRGYGIEAGRVVRAGPVGDPHQDETIECAHLGEAGWALLARV